MLENLKEVTDIIQESLTFQAKTELLAWLQETILDEKVAATVAEQLPDAIQAAFDKLGLA